MVSKDQVIGGAILLVCVLVAVFYIVAIVAPDQVSSNLLRLDMEKETFRLWMITIPVFIAFVAIMFIGAWIGWTMATTPPPKPIEEITAEIDEKKEE
ncbi:MAG: transcriptional regulator [Candidatus Bathyarchaeota archaeon]|jgi:uncharacterized membrane protein|nr:transcriptional regulator [Candidatus Termiticorpusculum sp.]MCL1970850.1 transcriptional regulator [Candidatus Termiticorpusculum sp.]